MPALVRLQKAYGNPWLIEVMQYWLKPPTFKKWGEPLDKLATIIKRWLTHSSTAENEIPHWLMVRQLSILKQQHHDQNGSRANHLNKASTRIASITELISAAVLAANDRIFKDTIDHLIANKQDHPLFDLIEINRFTMQQSKSGKKAEKQSRLLFDFVKNKVTKALNNSLRQKGDWSITESLPCDCTDCEILATFLQSRNTKHTVWPLAKRRRMHIHQTINAMAIHVTHITEPSGSPHKLHLTKTEQLFVQAHEHRIQLQEAMDELTFYGP